MEHLSTPICSRCNQRERQVFSTGRIDTYCRECNRDRRRSTSRVQQNGLCPRCGENERHVTISGNKEPYCRECCAEYAREKRQKFGPYGEPKLKEPLVYFIQVGKYVKIGSTSSTKANALRAVRKGNPTPCHYLFDLIGNTDREREIQHFFKDQLVTDPNIGGNELFRIEGELEYMLKAYLAGTDQDGYDKFVSRLNHAKLTTIDIPNSYNDICYIWGDAVT